MVAENINALRNPVGLTYGYRKHKHIKKSRRDTLW